MKKNPSRWSIRILICIFATISIVLATYMGLYEWRLIDQMWDPFLHTAQVLDSHVSHEITRIIRIPDAIFGVTAYIGDIIFALSGSTRRWQDRPWLVILFGIYVIPVGLVSIILVILQGTVVGAWCFWCLITASISLIMIFLGYEEVACSIKYLLRIWKRTKDIGLIWKTIWGTPSDIAYEEGLKIRPMQK